MQVDLTIGNVAGALALQSSEAALIEELQAGSEEAFAWLITGTISLFSLLARTVAAAQTPPTSLRKSSSRFSRHTPGSRRASLRTWIYRIALREASNQRRWWMRQSSRRSPSSRR